MRWKRKSVPITAMPIGCVVVDGGQLGQGLLDGRILRQKMVMVFKHGGSLEPLAKAAANAADLNTTEIRKQ